MKSTAFALLALLVFAPAAHAATVGAMLPGGGTTFGGSTAPRMMINLSHPATENASLTTATLRWGNGPASGCTAAFKIKFLRPTNVNTSYNVLAERGPFNAVLGMNIVPLSPPVSVQPGDVIGVTHLKPLVGCGSVTGTGASSVGVMYTISNSDPSTGPVGDTGLFSEVILNVRASTSADVVEGYLAGVGSTQGGFGSNFKTAVQLTNATDIPITGRFVFHPAGTPASPSDPTLSFTIPGQATTSYADIVAAMGRSGLGSMDIVSTNSHPPIVTTRVFNDAGAAGTSGLTLEMQTSREALRPFNIAEVTTPADPANFRLNIGVRSLDAGATLNIFARDANGDFLGVFVTRTYPANFFEQRSASDFTSLASIPANAVIGVQITAGSALIYGATTDNRTNDPNVKFFTRY